MTTPQSLIKDGKHVTYTPPFQSIAQFLASFSEDEPQKDALMYLSESGKKQTFSRIEFVRICQQLATAMKEVWGVMDTTSPGAVAFCLPNTPEVILCNFAAWSLGLTSVPLDNTRDTTERKIYKLQQAKVAILFTRDDASTRAENLVIAKSCPDLKIISSSNFSDFYHTHLKMLAPTLVYPDTDLDAPSLILYTSGTTALPKGVALTITNLFSNAESIRQWLQFSSTDRWQVVLPLHHINSTTFVNTTLLAGGTVVLIEKYSKSKFWQYAAETQSTGASIVPTIAYDLISEQQTFANHQKKLHQFKRFQLGSAPVQPRIVEQFMEQFSIPLYQGYGQTETSLRSTGVPMDLSANEFAHIRKSNSLGTELTYTNVAILDENGKQLGEEAVGEICVRGPIIMKEYIDNDRATTEAFAHGWFHSGDTGYYKELYGRSFFFLKGRTKEIIKKGGVLLSPLAVENALLGQYQELEQVYVVGFPDERLGERVGCVIVSKNPELTSQIIADARTGRISSLKSYELPDAVIAIEEDALPKTATGKVQRIELKKQYGELLTQQFRTIYQTKDGVVFRLIGVEEEKVLLKAVEIDQKRWGMHLAGKYLDFQQRAENGVLIGAFNPSQELLGTISALQFHSDELAAVDDPNSWVATWDGITGNGTLRTHTHKGDALLLVAVAVNSEKATAPAQVPPHPLSQELRDAAAKNVVAYLEQKIDPVIQFHQSPKAGMLSGATIISVIANGRKKDWEALGYSVLLKYPELSQEPIVSDTARISTQLVEAALLYAYQQKILNVFAYSRPSGFYTHITQK